MAHIVTREDMCERVISAMKTTPSRANISATAYKDIVNCVYKQIHDALLEGSDVILTHTGRLHAYTIGARKSKSSIFGGKSMKLPPVRSVSFKTAISLKKELNGRD